MLRVASAVAVAVVGLAALGAPNSSVAGDVSAVRLLPVVEVDNCSACLYCDADKFLVQDEWPGVPEDVGGAINTECNWIGSCDDLFPCAGFGSMEDVEALRLALNEGDIAQMEALLQAEPQVFLLNRERMAVQVQGCDENILAHFPISEDQLVALAN